MLESKYRNGEEMCKIGCIRRSWYYKSWRWGKDNTHSKIKHCGNLYHDNIITTITSISNKDDENFYIYLEYCGGGDLKLLKDKLEDDNIEFSINVLYI